MFPEAAQAATFDRMAKVYAKLKLDLEPDPEVNVIGISSHVNDYRLCWSLNRALDIGLAKRRQGIADVSDGIASHYSAFDHTDEESQTGCSLINNHGSDGILLKELRQVDHFLVVDKDWPQAPDELLRKVRSAEFVLTAFSLEFQQLREGHKLLL